MSLSPLLCRGELALKQVDWESIDESPYMLGEFDGIRARGTSFGNGVHELEHQRLVWHDFVEPFGG